MEPTTPTGRTGPAPLIIAVVFELSLAMAAMAVGRWLEINPCETLSFSWDPEGIRACAGGVLGAAPLLGLYFTAEHFAWPALRRIDDWLRQAVIPYFSDATIGDLAVVALAAGLGEEILFRGLLQEMVRLGLPDSAWGQVGALALASLCFGLAHFVTWLYFWLAALVGAYFGLLWIATGSLWTPIMAHASYDFVVLYYLSRGNSGPG